METYNARLTQISHYFSNISRNTAKSARSALQATRAPATGERGRTTARETQIVPIMFNLLKDMTISFALTQKNRLAAIGTKRPSAKESKHLTVDQTLVLDAIQSEGSVYRGQHCLDAASIAKRIQTEPFSFKPNKAITNQLAKDEDRQTYFINGKQISGTDLEQELKSLVGTPQGALVLSTLLGQDIPNLFNNQVASKLGFQPVLEPYKTKTPITSVYITEKDNGFVIEFRTIAKVKALACRSDAEIYLTDPSKSSLSTTATFHVSYDDLFKSVIDLDRRQVFAPVISKLEKAECKLNFERIAQDV